MWWLVWFCDHQGISTGGYIWSGSFSCCCWFLRVVLHLNWCIYLFFKVSTHVLSIFMFSTVCTLAIAQRNPFFKIQTKKFVQGIYRQANNFVKWSWICKTFLWCWSRGLNRFPEDDLIMTILPLFNDTEVFTEIFILAKFFGETFSENSHVDDFGSSLPTSLYSTNLKLYNISLTLKMAPIIADPWFLRGICYYLCYSGGFDELMCLKELYFEDGGKDLFVIPVFKCLWENSLTKNCHPLKSFLM